MNKTLVVVSTYIDSLIETIQPDTHFILFNNMNELGKHVESQPIVADTLFITAEQLEDACATALSFLDSQLQGAFFKVKRVTFILTPDSSCKENLQYYITAMKKDNWNIEQGALTREYVTGSICGSITTVEYKPSRRAVYRVKRSEYVKKNLAEQAKSENHYEVEEEMFRGVEPVVTEEFFNSSLEETCQVVNITGLPCIERTLFVWMLGQYLAFEGKVLIIEKDFKYLTLSDMALRSDMNFVRIDVQDLYADTENAFKELRNVQSGLVVITSNSEGTYNYSMLCNLLYNNIADSYNFMITEHELSEITPSSKYIVVMKNMLTEILKTVENLPDSYEENAKYVAMSITTIPELLITSSRVIEELLAKLLCLEKSKVHVPILTVNSLEIGGEISDIRSFIDKRR